MHISVLSLGREAQVHPETLLQLNWSSPVVDSLDWTGFGMNTAVYKRPTGGCAQQDTDLQAGSRVQWKTSETFRAVASHLNWGRGDLVREVTKNLMVSVRAAELICGVRRTFQKDNHLCSNPPLRCPW